MTHVLIIGAGCTGLLLAQGLKRAGVNATVYERETPEYYANRPREWGMSLHWGADAIQKVLPEKLRAKIREAWCDPFWNGELVLKHYHGHTGALAFETPLGDGTRVSRRKMRELFLEGVDVRYGKRLVSMKQDATSITALFEDGSEANGSLIVGCDGARSVVRELLVGRERAQNTFLDVSLFNFPCRFNADIAMMIRAQHPIFFNSYQPGGWMFWLSTQDVVDQDQPESWLFQLMFSWVGPPKQEDLAAQEARTAFIKSKASLYVEPWRTVLQAIPDDITFGLDRIAEWKPFDWSSEPLASHVTLAGDAAHAMAPYRGQGLNNGLEDAACLKELLANMQNADQELSSVLRQYEAEMRERSLKEIEISKMSAYISHDFEQLMNGPLAKHGVCKNVEINDHPIESKP